MIIDRLIARWALVAALTNYAAAPFPTLLGKMVFDSRIEPVEDFQDLRTLPICVVYTDYDKDGWRHHSIKRPRVLSITLEVLVAQVGKAPPEADAEYALAYPETDSETEAFLDILEHQIRVALDADNAAAECWRHLFQAASNVVSRRGATAEGGNKLAARQITVEAVMPGGTTQGVLAPPIAAFLDDIVAKEHYYAEYADKVRALYEAPASLSAAQQLIAAMGWSHDLSGKLGYEPGGSVVLPSDVVWVTSGGGSP